MRLIVQGIPETPLPANQRYLISCSGGQAINLGLTGGLGGGEDIKIEKSRIDDTRDQVARSR